MADNIAELNKSIANLNKNLQYLTGANLFNNARMNEMIEGTSKMKDNIEDISEMTNDIIKKSKEEEMKLKTQNTLLKKQNEIKKLSNKVYSDTLKIEELTTKEKELQAEIERKSTKRAKDAKRAELAQLREQKRNLEANNEENKKAIKLSGKELNTLREQTKEWNKQLAAQKEQLSLGKAFLSDMTKLGGNIKNLASGIVGKFLSASMFIEGWKNLYEMSNKVYDSYWSLSVPLQKANTGMWALKNKTEEYSKALREVKFTAARFGYDIDKIAPMMDTLQSKVKYLKKDSEGLWEWDIAGLADDAKQIVSISKMMNMESDEMITMLEERVRRFGDTNKEALNSMNSMAAATLTFNEIMEQGSVFTEEVGKHLMELHQNTKYWTQDFGMLNTMFNTHVSLLLKQGKHQKEALAIARQFQESLQQPPDLIKWKAGSKILSEFNAKIKGATDEEAVQKIMSEYGVGESEARTAVEAIRHGNNTQFTQANILQELFGGTKMGTNATINAWKGFMGFDSSALKDMGLASSVADAEKLKQLYKSISDLHLDANTSIEEAIDTLVDLEGGSEERKAELKALFGKNLNEAGQEPESAFENSILETMKDLKAWLDTPMVQIAAGGVAGSAGLLKNTLSTFFGSLASLFMYSKGGAVAKVAGSKIKSFGKAAGSKVKSFGNYANTLNATGRYADKLESMIKSGKYSDDEVAMLVARRRNLGRFANKRLPGSKFGLAAMGAGLLLGNVSDIEFEDTNITDIVNKGGGAVDLIRAGYASSAQEAQDLINQYRNGYKASRTAQAGTALGVTAELVSLFNPISFGITSLMNIGSSIAKNGLSINSVGTGLLDNLLNPLESIGKVVDSINKNKKGELGWLSEFVRDTRNFYKRGGGIEHAGATSEANARLVNQYKQRTLNKYDKELISLFGKEQIEQLGITSSNLEELVKNKTIEIEDEDTKKKVYSLISKIRGETSLDSLFGKYTEISETGINKYYEEALKDAKSFKSFGFSGSKFGAYNLRALKKAIAERYGTGSRGAEIYQAAMAQMQKLQETSKEGTMGTYTEKDAMYMVAHTLEEQYKKEVAEAIKQQRELEHQSKLQESMANYEQTLMSNSIAQTDSLRTLAQKASLDMLKDKDTYNKVIGENFERVSDTFKAKADAFGNIKFFMDKNVVAGSQAAVSQQP